MASKVILVTGASSGMGRAAAEILAEQGHVVYAAARRIEKMEDLKSKGIKTLKLDVSKELENVKVVETIIAAEKRIDVLVNNAGFGLYGTVEETPMDKARYQFDVNLFGLASLTQTVLPHMRNQGGGRIVNISSMGGKIYTPLGAWYHATKHAVEGWSDCLRLETKRLGIDVVVIEPGVIRTNFGAVVGQGIDPAGAKESPYREMIEPYLELMQSPRMATMGTDVQVLGRLIARASTVRRPRTRYVKGMMAKPMMFIRKYLGDRVFDAVITRAFG